MYNRAQDNVYLSIAHSQTEFNQIQIQDLACYFHVYMVILLIKHAMLIVVAFSMRGVSAFQLRRFRRLANPRCFYFGYMYVYLLGKANFSKQVVFLNPTIRTLLKIRGLNVFFLFLTRTICENREKVEETKDFCYGYIWYFD